MKTSIVGVIFWLACIAFGLAFVIENIGYAVGVINGAARVLGGN